MKHTIATALLRQAVYTEGLLPAYYGPIYPYQTISYRIPIYLGKREKSILEHSKLENFSAYKF